MQKYEPALLEQIKSLVPISRLVGEYIAADKRKSVPGDLWACCPFHSEKSPSFHAEDAKGIYHCFGCGANGDHFQWMQEHQGYDFLQAVQAVADLAGVTLPGARVEASSPAPRARYEAPETTDPYKGYKYHPAPADAPEIVAGKRTPPLRNPKRTDGKPTHYTPEDVYPYYNSDGELLGYVLRVVIEGKKLTPQIWWMTGPDGFEGWSHGSLPGKRPMDGLSDLLANPDKQVLVVEGEKCRKAAAAALRGRVVVVSWMGGTKAIAKTDFSPLAGRSLIVWPDNDTGGKVAMAYVADKAGAKKVKKVATYGGPGGDVADLIADGLSVADYIKANISDREGDGDGRILETDDHDHHTNELIAGNREPREEPPIGAAGGACSDDREASKLGRLPEVAEDPLLAPQDLDWEMRLIRTDAGAPAKKSPQNAMLHIQFHDDFRGIFAYNEFNHKIMLMRRPPWQPGRAEWTPRIMDEDDDSTALQGQLEYCGLTIGINDLARCVSRVAKFNRFNPVSDKLKSLQWDGVKRLSGEGQRHPWLVRYFGAAPDKINDVFGRKWFISACSRIINPGSQVDTVLIIEGAQGAMKSTSFRAICAPFGDSYFLDNLADPYGKDGKMAVQGKLIVELAELEAFRRSEESQKKSWITTRTDEFRPPYGRQVREYPRTFVIVGTENPTGTGYLKDSTGARRYWPVMSSEIDFELLKEDIEQLWAEAYAAYQAGEIWWLTKEEEALAAVEQRKRFKHDPWLPTMTRALKGEFKTNPEKMMEILDIPKKDRTANTNDRIVSILHMMQWRGITEGGELHYYRPD